MKKSLVFIVLSSLFWFGLDASAQNINNYKIKLPNNTVRTVGDVLSDLYTVKSYGAVCNNSNNDTQAIQFAANAAPYGATIRVVGQCKIAGEIVVQPGRTLEGPSQLIGHGGFWVDSNYRGVVVRLMAGATVKNLAIHSIDETHSLDSDSTQIGIYAPDAPVNTSTSVVIENVMCYGLGVGQKIQNMYHSLTNVKAHVCGIGQWVRGRENPNFIYSGAFQQDKGHIKGCQRAGLFVQGFTANVTYTGIRFEQNRYHVRALNGTLTLKSCYMGDDPKHSVFAEGAARVIIENRLVDPIHGGGATYWLGGQSTRSNYEGGSIYAVGTSSVIVRDGDLNNSIGFGNIGFTNGGLGLDQDRGQAIYIGPTASVRIEGQTKSNVISPLRGSGKLTADVAIPNYITGGSFDDPKRLPHAINAPITIDSTLRVPGAGYAATITQPGGVFYEVPPHMVGKTMYLVVANFGVSTGGSFAVLKPGVNTGFGRDSKGWTLVSRGNATYPWQSITGELADRISFLPAKYPDQAVIDRIPVRIDSARGSFSLYPSASVKLGGVWLMEADNLERIPIFKDVQVEYMASATPTRGTWRRGDAVRTYNTVSDGFSERICVVAGTPGTWMTLPVGGGGGSSTDTLYFDSQFFSGDGSNASRIVPIVQAVPTPGSVLPVRSGGVYDKLGNLAALNTAAKTNLVASINEVKAGLALAGGAAPFQSVLTALGSPYKYQGVLNNATQITIGSNLADAQVRFLPQPYYTD
ncbi:MAG: hypothetical protein H7Y12_01370, partial [Sphingobacteriaceae bacterium]|nr:hypothetical protein [Cytophagaceae bacterium]